MNRIFAFILLVILSLGTHVKAVTLSIPDSQMQTGASVDIPIHIDNAESVAGFQFTLTFDPSVLEISEVKTGSLTAGWTIQKNTSVSGQVQLVGLDTSLAGIADGNGSLAILCFNVIGSAGATTAISFTESKLSDADAQAIPAITEKGTFIVSANSSEDTGTLSVDTTPVKGEVFVDGESWGTAPQSKSISAGTHTVSFGSRDGYGTPVDQTATVEKNQATSIMGNYAPILTIHIVGQGSVSPSSGSYELNANLTLKATPAEGWVFDHWEGDLSGSSNPMPLTMDASKAMRAVFVLDLPGTGASDFCSWGGIALTVLGVFAGFLLTGLRIKFD